MADIVECHYPLAGRASKKPKVFATELSNGRERYQITRAGRLLRVLSTDSTSTQECAFTGVARLRASRRGEAADFIVTSLSGRVSAIQRVLKQVRADYVQVARDLARKVNDLRQVIAKTERDLFSLLWKTDPEVAALAMLVFDDRRKAAAWLSHPYMLLYPHPPFRLITMGKRKPVIQELYAILYGFPT